MTRLATALAALLLVFTGVVEAKVVNGTGKGEKLVGTESP